MVELNNEKQLSCMLRAMSDSTRRNLLTQLCRHGPARVTDLAEMYDMSLNAISKHIKVLEKCHLVSRTPKGRTHWINADLNQVSLGENWLHSLKSIWALRLDQLEKLLTNKEGNHE